MSDIYNESIPGPRGSALKHEHLQYTRADLDAARKQGAAKMRDMCIEAVRREALDEERDDKECMYNNGVMHAIQAIQKIPTGNSDAIVEGREP